MPSRMASAVLWIVTGRPSKGIEPVSAVAAPERILISVDLPAPFSPTRACTDPAWTVMSALRMARTAPYRLDTPVTDRRSAPVSGGSGWGAAASADPVVRVSLIVSSLRTGPGRAGDTGPPRGGDQ